MPSVPHHSVHAVFDANGHVIPHPGRNPSAFRHWFNAAVHTGALANLAPYLVGVPSFLSVANFVLRLSGRAGENAADHMVPPVRILRIADGREIEIAPPPQPLGPPQPWHVATTTQPGTVAYTTTPAPTPAPTRAAKPKSTKAPKKEKEKKPAKGRRGTRGPQPGSVGWRRFARDRRRFSRLRRYAAQSGRKRFISRERARAKQRRGYVTKRVW